MCRVTKRGCGGLLVLVMLLIVACSPDNGSHAAHKQTQHKHSHVQQANRAKDLAKPAPETTKAEKNQGKTPRSKPADAGARAAGHEEVKQAAEQYYANVEQGDWSYTYNHLASQTSNA